jgi:two-component system sensor histidine kinase PhoQ
MARPPSVRRQLIVAVAVPLVLSFVLTILALDNIFRQSAQQSLSARLDEEIVALVTAAEFIENGRMDLHVLDPESRLSRRRSGQYAMVRDTHGHVLWRSPSLAGLPLDFGPLVATGGTSFQREMLADGSVVGVLSRGLEWDYAPGGSANLVFSVAENLADQNARLLRFRREMVAWFGMLAVLLLGVLGELLRRVLRPIRRLELEIAEVDRGQSAQLGTAYPRELAGVARSLNALLRSEQRRILRYRDTLGNLAHSLKTPLAVMRAGLAGGAEQRGSVDQEIDRIAQIIDHHLKRAATSGGVAVGQGAVAVAPLLAELRATMLKVHSAKDLTIETEAAAHAGFLGDRGDIVELLGNLLDNACKWCSGRVRAEVRLLEEREGQPQLLIRIEDDGPGIAPGDRGRVLARGVRADERAPGHGLGLAMVADTVALYGGDVLIAESAALKGARIEVTLPGRLLETDVLTSPG